MFAVLHIPDFALHAVLRTEHASTGKPAALFATSSKKSVVLASTAAARVCGVELGMTAPQAVARCPDLLIRTPNAGAETEARAALLATGFMLSPSIEDTAPGVCTADLRGNTTPPEPLACPELSRKACPELSQRATAALTQLNVLGLPATAGIGRTPLLALYAARAVVFTRPSPQTISEELPLGLVAESEAALPHSLATSLPYVPHAERVQTIGDEKNFLAPLPLATADPSPELASVLHGWGLSTLGDLTALPRDEIVRRFGAEGLMLWNRAAGGEPRPLHLVAPTQTFSATMEFEHEIETLEPLLFILRRFLDRLTVELRAAQLIAAEVELTLRLEDETTHTRGFRLPEPTGDVEILFRTLHTHLESLQTAASIRALDLRVSPTRPLVRQHGLFETGLRDPHGFAETLARVSALVNADRVGTPQREDTYRPDAFKLVAPAAVVPPPAPPPVHPPQGLPLRRFRPPLLANLEFSLGTRRPTYVFTHRFAGDIAEIRGPWRGSGDWWQPDRAWERLEYDITLADGGLYRLLQIGDAYFIEGEYD